MITSTTKVVADTPIRRVLATVERLTQNLDERDLPHIDGEFYWKCCHHSVLPLIAELRTIRDSGVVRYLDGDDDDEVGNLTADGPTARWGPLADEASWEAYTRFGEIYHAAAEIVPETVVGELLAHDAVSMHPAEMAFTSRSVEDKLVEAVVILVYSGGWTGRDVEVAISRTVEHFGLPRPDLDPAGIHVSHMNIWLARDLKIINRAMASPDDRTARVPAIVVYLPMPLPPPGSVEREFDAVARQRHRWHLELPGGSATRQDKEVAIRTWGVALLLGARRQFGQAMRLVCEAGHLSEVSQTRFGVDRQRVIDRVPEAKAFLMQRKKAA